MLPETEFRTLSVTETEPLDRTNAGTVLVNGASLDFGTVDTTDEARDIPVTALWWRVTDMNGATEISNVRIWLDGADAYSGSSAFYSDISDSWVEGKSAVEVRDGSPGNAPLTRPTSNITKLGGGVITGTSHDECSQYIYIAGTIAVDETIGDKSGMSLRVEFDYR